MPKINIEIQSSLSKSQTYDKLKALFESDVDLKKLDSSYVCQFDSANHSGSAKGTKFSASMIVKDAGQDVGTKAAVSVNVDIPFLLSPFKNMIRETLEKKLKKVLS